MLPAYKKVSYHSPRFFETRGEGPFLDENGRSKFVYVGSI